MTQPINPNGTPTIGGVSLSDIDAKTVSSDFLLQVFAQNIGNLDSQIKNAITGMNNRNALGKQWSDFTATAEKWTQIAEGKDLTADNQAGHIGMAKELAAEYQSTTDPTLRGEIAGLFQKITGKEILPQPGEPASKAFFPSEAAMNAANADPKSASWNTSNLSTADIHAVSTEDYSKIVAQIKDEGSQATSGTDLDMLVLQQVINKKQQMTTAITTIQQTDNQSMMAILQKIS